MRVCRCCRSKKTIGISTVLDIRGRRAPSANRTYGLSSSLFTIRIAAVTRVYEVGASHGARRLLIIEIVDRASLRAVYRRLGRALVKWYHEDPKDSVGGSKNPIDDNMWSHHVAGDYRAPAAPRRC